MKLPPPTLGYVSGQVGKVGMGPGSAGDSVVLTSVRAHFCSNLIVLMIVLTE